MDILDSLSLPLNQSVLIEASAGTGKTYTMANLYLRLILGVGCEPLSVEQILVVTFTKAATQELRDRIRDKLSNVAKWFQEPESEAAKQGLSDPFVQSLFEQVQPELSKAILRLRIAEREMDLASIFTIDSFCQKMLFQYAFDSGVRFDVDLQANESELLKRLSEETWRELFYPANREATALVSHLLGEPNDALKIVRKYLSGELVALNEQQAIFANNTLDNFLQQRAAFIRELKAFWLENRAELIAIIDEERNRDYPKGAKKALSRRSYTENSVMKTNTELNQWAESESLEFPYTAWEKYTQCFICDKMEEGADKPLIHIRFSEMEKLYKIYQAKFDKKEYVVLIFSFLHRLREKLADYKLHHKEKSFDDMTTLFYRALSGENGEQFAKTIRHQFKFAMIDEFQDTNLYQYAIFSQIFIPKDKNEKVGFIMIGDPKQSIYKFRNADIFSYLSAKDSVSLSVTMDRNWRSSTTIVENTNRLFDFQKNGKSPFIYDGIQFQPVKAKQNQDEHFIGQAATPCYLLENYRDESAAEWCAYQIQQQLKLSEQGELYLQKKSEKRPLAAQDIAVLVRDKAQANLIKNALRECHIQAIYLSARESVFNSVVASDLYLLLKACLDPYRKSVLLASLGSSLWQFNASELYQFKQNEIEWENWISRFIEYKKIWQYQGILPMLHRIFLDEGIIQRLNQTAMAERTITDLFHLAELLQEAAASVENETALLHWFKQQLDSPDDNADEQKLRLESEQKLVKIITIHGSKGLEYPVVWLPFAGIASKKFIERRENTPVIYRNEQNQRCWGFSPLSDDEKALINKEEFAEDLRLFYVAVTRAKHQLNFILPKTLNKNWSAAGYLLSDGEMGLSGNPSLPTESYLTQKALQCEIVALDEQPPVDPWRAAELKNDSVQARHFDGKIQQKGLITSFSALQAQHERLQNRAENRPLVWGDSALDYDRETVVSEAWSEQDESDNPFSPYHFPHSTKVGNRLHKLFEKWDFSQPLDEAEILALCESLNLDEAWQMPVREWLQTVVATPFAEGLQLNQIEPQKRLNEWQFYLRLRNEKALPQLNQLLKTESRLAKTLPDLKLQQLEGFVKGFVDLIVQASGKFYIMDYKSNFLGSFAQDYSPQKIEKVMGQYRYDLQYLLYTLALHRYLRSRLGENYDYERDFGGVAYLFLRGMNGEPNSGVFFDKPSVTLIEKLDQLFD